MVDVTKAPIVSASERVSRSINASKSPHRQLRRSGKFEESASEKPPSRSPLRSRSNPESIETFVPSHLSRATSDGLAVLSAHGRRHSPSAQNNAWELREQSKHRATSKSPDRQRSDGSTLPQAFRQMYSASPTRQKTNQVVSKQEWEKRAERSRHQRSNIRESVATWINDD